MFKFLPIFVLLVSSVFSAPIPKASPQVAPDMSLQNPLGDDNNPTTGTGSGFPQAYTGATKRAVEFGERGCDEDLEERQVAPDMSLQNPLGDDNNPTVGTGSGFPQAYTGAAKRDVEEAVEERQVAPDMSLQNPLGDDNNPTTGTGSGFPQAYTGARKRDAETVEERQVAPDMSLQNPLGDDNNPTVGTGSGFPQAYTGASKRDLEERDDCAEDLE